MIINEVASSVVINNSKYLNTNEIGIHKNPYNKKELVYLVKSSALLQKSLLSIIRNLQPTDYPKYNIYNGDNLLIISNSQFAIRPIVSTKSSMIHHLPGLANLLNIPIELQTVI